MATWHLKTQGDLIPKWASPAYIYFTLILPLTAQPLESMLYAHLSFLKGAPPLNRELRREQTEGVPQLPQSPTRETQSFYLLQAPSTFTQLPVSRNMLPLIYYNDRASRSSPPYYKQLLHGPYVYVKLISHFIVINSLLKHQPHKEIT